VVGVKMEYQPYTRTIAAKRERYAQALCAAFSFGCNPTNGNMVYMELFTLRG
jgi:hypothetical protein